MWKQFWMESNNGGARSVSNLTIDPATGRYVPYSCGLGTRIAHFIKRLGIRQKPGCGCAKRQAWLDRQFPLQFLSRLRKR